MDSSTAAKPVTPAMKSPGRKRVDGKYIYLVPGRPGTIKPPRSSTSAPRTPGSDVPVDRAL